jgi:hypothetical protein
MITRNASSSCLWPLRQARKYSGLIAGKVVRNRKKAI